MSRSDLAARDLSSPRGLHPRPQAASLNALVYDHPGFGAPDTLPSQPRQEIDPWQQIRCIQDAISYAQTRDDVDAERIGIWGSSYGAHAYVVGAIDRRIKELPSARTHRQLGRDGRPLLGRGQAIAGCAEPTLIPVVDADPTALSALPTPDSYEWFTATAEERAPSWRNEVTMTTMEFFRGYEPGSYIPDIAPTRCS